MVVDEAQALQLALARLPDHDRELIVLRHREGRSFAEIARLLNRSPEEVRMLWAQAVDRLQNELESGHEHPERRD